MHVRPDDKQPMLCWIMKDPQGQLIGETMSCTPRRAILWAKEERLVVEGDLSNDSVVLAKLAQQGYTIKVYSVQEL